MGKYKCMMLVLMLSLGISLSAYAQEGPPPPQNKSHRGGPPCDPGNGNGNGTPGGNNPDRPGVPPPVGLCLPIDDYVYLLMAVGVMYGCYKLRGVEIS